MEVNGDGDSSLNRAASGTPTGGRFGSLGDSDYANFRLCAFDRGRLGGDLPLGRQSIMYCDLSATYRGVDYRVKRNGAWFEAVITFPDGTDGGLYRTEELAIVAAENLIDNYRDQGRD
jgi:hypothetical protein